jgi:hypothetical protein
MCSAYAVREGQANEMSSKEHIPCLINDFSGTKKRASRQEVSVLDLISIFQSRPAELSRI